MILSLNKWWHKIFFLSCPRHWDLGLIVVIVYNFQILNKKERNIIIRRVISCHMCPIYIETPYAIPVHRQTDAVMLALTPKYVHLEAKELKLSQFNDTCNSSLGPQFSCTFLGRRNRFVIYSHVTTQSIFRGFSSQAS